MAIVSLGRTSVDTHYSFNSPFDVLRNGGGYFGGGVLQELVGNVMANL